MPTRRRYLALAGVTALAGCGFTTESGTETGGGDDGGSGESGGDPTGDGRLPTARENDGPTSTGQSSPLVFSTAAFEDGGTIPAEYTGAGADRSPPLTVESVPAGAETLALVVDDPDANGFVHWLLWNVPADVTEIPAGLPQRETLPDLGGARQGTNDFGELGYRGPLPPESDGPHTYRFRMYAVSTTLGLEAGAERSALADALEGSMHDAYRITGEFDR